MCGCGCVCVLPLVWLSLYTTPIHHSSLSPLGQLITFSCSLTHIKKTSPFQTVWTDFMLPLPPLSCISLLCGPKAALAVSAPDPSSFHRLWPGSDCWEVQPALTSGRVRDFNNCQEDVFIGHPVANDHYFNSIRSWFHRDGTMLLVAERTTWTIPPKLSQYWKNNAQLHHCQTRSLLSNIFHFPAHSCGVAGLLAMLSSPETQRIVFMYTCTNNCAFPIRMADFWLRDALEVVSLFPPAGLGCGNEPKWVHNEKFNRQAG